MDPWIIGLVAVIVIGLAVITYGALSDRARNQRRAAEMLAPPQRNIPRFTPDAPSPQYLSELQARRPPVDAPPTDLTSEERHHISQSFKGAPTLSTGYATRDFITDPTSSWAVLDHPRILVCAEPVESFREILSVCEKLIMARAPLIIAAPAFAQPVLDTLGVNAIQHTMQLLAVTPNQSDLAQLSQVTGATALSRSDLQAGYVLPEHLGSCDRWVSSATKSFVISTTLSETV